MILPGNWTWSVYLRQCGQKMGFLLSYGSVWCPCHFFGGGWGLYKHISEHGRMLCSKGLVFQHRARFLKEAAIVQENCQIHIPSCTSMGAKILSEVYMIFYMAVVFFFRFMPLTIERRIAICLRNHEFVHTSTFFPLSFGTKNRIIRKDSALLE